jgi:hypothetical protein
VQVVAHLPLERRAMQKREEKVDAREVQFEEMVDQVRFREGVVGQVESEGRAFPLFRVPTTPSEQGQRAHAWLSETHCVLSPELGSAPGHALTHMVLFGAAVFGFEIEGGLYEVRGTRFAKETVADAELVERVLKAGQLGVDIFVVARLQVVLARIVQ